MALTLEARLRVWANARQHIRAFFEARQVIEVVPPSLMAAPVTDPFIEVPRAHSPTGQFLGYLQSSPEYAMKRLLAAGSGDIFALAQAWRVDERSPRHRLEFTLLEWYRTGFTGQQLRHETSELLQGLLGCEPATEISYRDAFLTHLGECPFAASDEWIAEQLRTHLQYTDPLPRDQALQWLCAVCVEPNLGKGRPQFLTHYPLGQAALARGCEHQGMQCADRFELFFEGVELANGYFELTDPDEQRLRFEQDNQTRMAEGRAAVPIDQALLDSLSDMPDCAGIAMGLDRVLMLQQGLDSIHLLSLLPDE